MQIAAPSHLHDHRRIVVYVVTGSGKSTLAARLAALTGIPHVAVDDLMWRPGWVQVEARQQVEALRPAVSRPEWILDAVWSAPRDLVLSRTQLATRKPICGENIESWRQTLSRDSIIAWHFRSSARKRETIAAWASDAGARPSCASPHRRGWRRWLGTLEVAHP